MKIQYLGTGAAEGFPAIFCRCEACRKARQLKGRNVKTRSCSLINDKVLIDLSPDIFMQSLKWNIDLSLIRDVVMTHSHGDHMDIFTIQQRDKAAATIMPDVKAAMDYLKFYGDETVGDILKQELKTGEAESSGRIRFRHIVPGEKFKIGTLTFTALRANHRANEECLIYAITDGEKSMLYANDTGILPEETMAMIENLGIKFDLVSMDCARGTLPGDSHMGINEDIRLKQSLENFGCVSKNIKYVLNHYSHMCGLTPDEFQIIVENNGMNLAYDGMTVEI